MEFGETEKKKVNSEVPWIPSTPFKPIAQRPVQICTTRERNQLNSHFISFMTITKILKSIDVDQVVEKHQSSSTPQPPMSKFPSIAPTPNKDNFSRQGDTFLAPERCLDCIHGY